MRLLAPGRDQAPQPDPGEQSSTQQVTSSRAFVVVSVLLTVGAVCLGFVLSLVLVSPLIYARDQEVVFSDFRSDLATALAPIGQTDVEGVVLTPGDPVAVLEIPVLGLQSVVLEGTTSTVMQSGPGHKRDTVLPGQAGTSVIFGRAAAFGGPFGEIGRLEPGSTILVISGQGEHEYEVIGVRRAGDPIPPPVVEGEGRLILVTADGPAFQPADLLRVDAKLVSPPQVIPPRVLASSALAASEMPLAGDPDALVPLILWGQLLVIAVVSAVWLLLRWGRWQAWLVAAPVIAYLGLMVALHATRLLPNVM